MKIYISLPISGKNVMTQTGIALSVAEQIRDLGHEPVRPFGRPPLRLPNGLSGKSMPTTWGATSRSCCSAMPSIFARGGKKVVVAVLNPTLPRLMASNPITT